MNDRTTRMSLEEYRQSQGLGPAKTSKPSKYRNVRTQAFNGRWYDSLKESNYADGLDMAKAEGEIVGYLEQVSIPIGTDENGNRVRYVVDFVVRDKNGFDRLIDVKGKDTPTSTAKRAALRDLGFDVELV